MFTSTMLRMYTREARFFEELAHLAPLRVPACHHASIDQETSQFVLVMEDIGGLRAVDQVVGMALADAERAVDGLAAWHATWWGQAGRSGRGGAHREPRRRDLQGGAPAGVRRGVGEADGRAGRPRRPSSPSAPRWTDAMPAAARRAGRGADHDDPRGLPGRQPLLRGGRLGGGGRLPAHRHRARRLRPGVLRHPEHHQRGRQPARAGPVRPLDGGPGQPAGVPEATSRRRGTTTGRPPCSASSTPSWRGAGWTPAIPASGTSPPRCWSGSTGRWPSSTSPSCSDAWRIRRALAYAGNPQPPAFLGQ